MEVIDFLNKKIMVKGLYQITYSNGLNQLKILISHDDYMNVIRPLEIEIDFLKSTIKKKSKDKKELEKKQELHMLKLKRKSYFSGDYFTDKSPFYEAIETGILNLPKAQGGSQKCNVSLIF